MTLKEVKEIPITLFMENIGQKVIKRYSSHYVYRSPLSKETNVNYIVNVDSNEWGDTKSGWHGDILSLGERLYNSMDTDYLIYMISSFARPKRYIPARLAYPSNGREVVMFQDIRVTSLKSNEHRSFLMYKGIDLSIAEKKCFEVKYQFRNKTHTALAFQNDKFGYELLGKSFRGCLDKQGITSFINCEKKNAACLFENFLDYLSYLTLIKAGKMEVTEDNVDCIVFNSLELVPSAITGLTIYKRVYSYLRNTNSGRLTKDLLNRKKLDWMEDMSAVYLDKRSLTDYLMYK